MTPRRRLIVGLLLLSPLLLSLLSSLLSGLFPFLSGGDSDCDAPCDTWSLVGIYVAAALMLAWLLAVIWFIASSIRAYWRSRRAPGSRQQQRPGGDAQGLGASGRPTRGWQGTATALTAGLAVILAAGALGIMSVLLFYGYHCYDLPAGTAKSCRDEPVWDEPLLIGGPTLIVALVLLAVHRGRGSAWLAGAAATVAWAGVLASWLITLQ